MIPERSIEQRMTALERANHIRIYRSAVKRDVATGRREFTEVLAADDPDLATMKVIELILCVPKVGRVKALTFLDMCGVSVVKTIGGLSERQKKAVTTMRLGPLPPAEARRESHKPSLRVQLARARAELEALRMERAA